MREIAMMLLLAGCASTAPSPERIDQISQDVVRLSGLPPRAAPPLVAVEPIEVVCLYAMSAGASRCPRFGAYLWSADLVMLRDDVDWDYEHGGVLAHELTHAHQPAGLSEACMEAEALAVQVAWNGADVAELRALATGYRATCEMED